MFTLFVFQVLPTQFHPAVRLHGGGVGDGGHGELPILFSLTSHMISSATGYSIFNTLHYAEVGDIQQELGLLVKASL